MCQERRATLQSVKDNQEKRTEAVERNQRTQRGQAARRGRWLGTLTPRPRGRTGVYLNSSTDSPPLVRQHGHVSSMIQIRLSHSKWEQEPLTFLLELGGTLQAVLSLGHSEADVGARSFQAPFSLPGSGRSLPESRGE